MNYKEIVYKKKLLDAILEQRDYMGITKIMDEVDAIYNNYSSNKQVPIKDNTYLELSINSAVISYKIYPYMDIFNRISLINGINFATEFLKYNENNIEFKAMPLDNKVNLAIEAYNNTSISSELDINSKHYLKKGIKSYISLKYINNNKSR